MGNSQTSRNAQSRRGVFDAVSKGYARLQDFVIRPVRQMYTETDLGPVMFTFGGLHFDRTDYSIRNDRGMILRCSHWQQAESARGCYHTSSSTPVDYQPPCMIYCHGNAGSRLEARDVLATALSMGCSFFAFDFSGSGISEGEHVSLGWYEKYDLNAVVTHLKTECNVGRIVLWGRSMGAVTAMLYGDHTRDAPEVHGLVLDSPFSDFEVVATERVDHARSKGLFAPGASCLVPIVLAMLSSSIEVAAGFDPRKLNTLTAAGRCTIPALFLIADEDQFVPPSHGEKLFATYAGPKGLLTFAGDHNSRRPFGLYEYATRFLDPCVQVPPGVPKPAGVPLHNNLRLPWETLPMKYNFFGCGLLPGLDTDGETA